MLAFKSQFDYKLLYIPNLYIGSYETNSDFGLHSSTSESQQLDFKTRIRYNLSLLKVFLTFLAASTKEAHAEAQHFRVLFHL